MTETYLEHPTQDNIHCPDEECNGKMEQRKRNVSLRVKGTNITVPNSEYWECPDCASILTTQEEIDRIRKEAAKKANFSGKFLLRLPQTLHQKLAEQAEENHRSLNGEILTILKQNVVSKL